MGPSTMERSNVLAGRRGADMGEENRGTDGFLQADRWGHREPGVRVCVHRRDRRERRGYFPLTMPKCLMLLFASLVTATCVSAQAPVRLTPAEFGALVERLSEPGGAIDPGPPA